MNTLKNGIIALLIATAVCTLFSWPLARHAMTGIPSSSSNVEKDNLRAMIPGDHLQFLYHMWLAKDTFTGGTPLFHNLYEFNVGDDAERYEVRPYYLPFSLFFTIGALIGGQAFGWNFTILVSFWLTYWFAWKLARRYHPDTWVSAAIALIAITLPFPWIVLLGGSPTGFSMMWVPILLYGIDRWIGDKSFAGAALTGAALFFAEWSDTHVFFFNAMITPFWCLLAYLHSKGWSLPTRDDLLGWLKSSAPLVVFCGLVAYKALSVHQGLQDTPIAGGRSLHEVALNSHSLDGLTSLRADGDGRKIYVGIYGLVLLGLALVSAVIRIIRNRKSAAGWCLLFLVIGAAGIFMLSTGVKNPLGDRGWQILTKAVPPYGMIRQPDKIFCILPAVLLVIGALALKGSRPFVARVAAVVLIAPLVWDFSQRLNPTISSLDAEQGAYRAVAEHARATGVDPHVLVIPLWPGNSHYSSIYQYYVSLYRIRMVNGYRPTPRNAYLEDIFEPFQSVNSGYPSNEQLDNLLERGVGYILLHEDAFPEKVSSFPVDATLFNLLSHPRLEPLERDGPVWSFVIRPPAEADWKDKRDLSVLFPVRYWDWERCDVPETHRREDDDAINNRYITLDADFSAPVTGSWVRTGGHYPMAWHLRARGDGSARIAMSANDHTFEQPFSVIRDQWTWLTFPVPFPDVNAEQQTVITLDDGRVDLDVVFMTRSDWTPPDEPGKRIDVPATAFFRAGYTLDGLDGVVLRKDYDPADRIFYSRNLYLLPGMYRIEMTFETDAPGGTELGTMKIEPKDRSAPAAETRVTAGLSAIVEYTHPNDRFFNFGFTFTRNADITIKNIGIERISN